MTQVEFNNFLKLSDADKQFVVSGMNNNQLMELINFVTGNTEQFCLNCSYWKETCNGYGICQCANSNFYQQETNNADGCYEKENDKIMDMINETIVSRIQYK